MSQFNVTIPTWNGAPIGNQGGAPTVAGKVTNYNPATSGANYTGGGAQQTPSIFGTGTYMPPAYPINQTAITGTPLGSDSNYGLNNAYTSLQNALNGLQVRNYAATAPTGTAPMGTAGQGTASAYTAPQGSASGYGAAQGQGAAYNAALGGASSVGDVSGLATTGGASYADPTRISTAGDLAWQAQQQGLANVLATQAAGGGMSPADLQLGAGEEQALANQLAALGSQRGGGNFALAQRSAADQAASTEQNTNYQAALLRANETLQAQQALGGVLGTARGQAQNYNVNQANLLQGNRQFNAGNLQNMTLADMAALNSQTQQNTALAQQANEFNAGNAQNMTLADMAARNSALQFNAGNSQQAMLANQGAVNAASQYNAGNSQQMALANLLQQGQALQYNAGNSQQMSLANLAAQNQFGMANLENAQQMGLANLNLAGQYGIQNQNAAIQAQNQYDQQLLGLLGAQTGIGQSNRAAQLAANQLGVQQNTALDQIAAEAYASSAQANANLTGGVIGGIAGLGATGINALANSGGGGNLTNMPGYSVDPTQGGATATDVLPGTEQLIIPQGVYPQLSDENLKTGVEGGNPMLDSFLRQYDESRGKTEDIDPDEGLGFHVQRYSRALSGGTPGNTTGSQVGSAIGGTAGGAALGAAAGSVVPGIGTAIGGLIGSLVGSSIGGDIGSLANTKGSGGGSYSQMTSPATGLQRIGVSDEDTEAFRGRQSFSEDDDTQAAMDNADPNTSPSLGYMPMSGRLDLVQLPAPSDYNFVHSPSEINLQTAQEVLGYRPDLSRLSDENEKEAVTSGNRGLQAFLEQQNTQTNAQNQQGAYNNAFMQTGGPPTPQVNTQLPPSVGAGYGQPSLADMLSSGYGGGGIGQVGGYYAGGYQGGGMTAPGSYLQALLASQGSEYGAGMTNPGSYSAGGVTSSPAMSGGGMAPGGAPAAPPATRPVPMPDLSTRSVGATGVTAPINQPLTGVAKAPLNPSGYTPQPAASAAYGGIVPLDPNTGGGFAPPAVNNPTIYTNTPALRLSDETQKTSVSSDTSDMRDFLDSLHAHSYRYKNPDMPGAGHGTYVSPMAQELEQSDLGKSFVVTSPQGHKMVDYGKMAGTQLAATAMMNERVSKLEKLLKGSYNA